MTENKQTEADFDQLAAVIGLQLWEDYLDSVIQNSATPAPGDGPAEAPFESDAERDLFLQYYGATEKSPLAWLYATFQAGIAAGLSFADRLEKAFAEHP